MFYSYIVMRCKCAEKDNAKTLPQAGFELSISAYASRALPLASRILLSRLVTHALPVADDDVYDKLVHSQSVSSLVTVLVLLLLNFYPV